MDHYREGKNVFLAGLFMLFVMAIQLQNAPLIATGVAASALLWIWGRERDRSFVRVTLLFSAGFSVYLFVFTQLIPEMKPREWEMLLKRGALLFILGPLWFWSGGPLPHFLKKSNWQDPFRLPGHNTTIGRFLIIAFTVNLAVFLPFMIHNGWLSIKESILLALVFSLTNAILEEYIWRGVLLSRFSSIIGVQPALWITSLGFGLQHYSLGFAWPVCFAFAFGGFFYGALTVQAKSLVPAMIWHSFLNVLMVFSGLIER